MKLAFYRGHRRLFDRLVQWWTRAEYSHCELVLAERDDGLSECASSSFLDGGVRLKLIRLAPEKWDIIDIDGDAEAARAWFHQHIGNRYDLLGLLGFIWPRKDDQSRWFCSEAVAASIGLTEPWRYSPGGLAAVAQSLVNKRPD